MRGGIAEKMAKKIDFIAILCADCVFLRQVLLAFAAVWSNCSVPCAIKAIVLLWKKCPYGTICLLFLYQHLIGSKARQNKEMVAYNSGAPASLGGQNWKLRRGNGLAGEGELGSLHMETTRGRCRVNGTSQMVGEVRVGVLIWVAFFREFLQSLFSVWHATKCQMSASTAEQSAVPIQGATVKSTSLVACPNYHAFSFKAAE